VTEEEEEEEEEKEEEEDDDTDGEEEETEEETEEEGAACFFPPVFMMDWRTFAPPMDMSFSTWSLPSLIPRLASPFRISFRDGASGPSCRAYGVRDI
jgi:hypothetical protein